MPMDRKYYPPNWSDLALQIKADAKWTCQRCYRPCRQPGETAQDLCDRLRPYPALQTESLHSDGRASRSGFGE